MKSRIIKKRLKALSTRSQKHKRYVGFDYNLLETEAFKHLTGGAFKLLAMVKKRYNGTNNGEISFSVREGRDLLGYSLNTISRYFNELEVKGFLKVKEKGRSDPVRRLGKKWAMH